MAPRGALKATLSAFKFVIESPTLAELRTLERRVCVLPSIQGVAKSAAAVALIPDNFCWQHFSGSPDDANALKRSVAKMQASKSNKIY